MASQLADVNPPLVHEAAEHPLHDDPTKDEGTHFVRGVVFAILFSLPFWGLVAFTIYLLR